MTAKKSKTPAKSKASKGPAEKSSTAGPSLLDLAAPIAEKVKIISIVLADCKANRTPDADNDENDLRLSIQIIEVEFGIHSEQNTFFVKPAFALSAKKESAAGSVEPLFTVEATFALVYSVPTLEEVEEENLQAFARTNGVFNAWPYWREFVQNTVSRMGLPSITIPVFRF